MDHPRYTALKVTEKGETTPLTAYKYKPQLSVALSHFVLKGSPEIIGGPGLTVRRYAAYPLRGYNNVGFRWIVRQIT
jgi:hypothetical protein